MAEEILFRINLFGAESIKDLEDTVKSFKSQLKTATDPAQVDAWARAVKNAESELKAVNKQVNEFTKAQAGTKEFPNTVQGLRDKLSALNKEWKNAEIGSKVFKDLEANSAALTDKLKKLEAATGDNRRNVGNYADALKGLGGPMGGAISGAQGFNTALKANPILLIVGLLIQFIAKLSENAKVADFVTRIMGALNKAFQFVIDSVVGLITNFDKFTEAIKHPIDSIRNFFSGAADAAKEGFNAAKALDEMTVSSAKLDSAIRANQRNIDALTKSLKDKTKSEEERIRIANEIADLEISNSKKLEEKAKAALDQENLRLKGKQLNAEEEKKLIELQSDLDDAVASQKEVNAQRQTRINILLDKQANDSIKTTADAEKEKAKIIREEGITRLAEIGALNEKLKQVNKEFIDSLIEQERDYQKQLRDAAAKAERDKDVVRQEEIQRELTHRQNLLDTINITGNLDEQLQARLKFDDAQRTQEIEAADNNGQAIDDIVRKHNAIQEDLKRQSEEVKLGIVQGALGQLSAVAGKDTAAGKAFALAQAGINTYLAVSKAITTYPFPLNLLAGGATAAFGLKQIQGIVATDVKGFADSGLTGQLIGANDGLRIKRSNGDNLLATVRSGEVILNERHQRMLGGAGTFRSMGVPGFANSGLTPSFSPSDLSGNNNGLFDVMNESVKAMNNRIDRIKVLNVEAESTNSQNRVKNIEAMATA